MCLAPHAKMEGWDQREKRKVQNRIAQRRFRSRKKGIETVFLHPDQENAESASGSGSGAQSPRATSVDQPSALPGAAQPELQGFRGDIDFNSMMTVNTPEDLFAGLSGAFVSKTWLRPPHILSPPSEDAHPANEWKGYNSLGSHVDAAAHGSIGSGNHPSSNAGNTFTSAEYLESPTSISATRKATSSALATAEAVQLYTVTGRSPSVHSAPAINDHDSEYPFPNATQKSQNKRRSLSASTNKKRVGCCVAHKAESMVSDLQKLYNYGVHFWFFEAEDDEVDDCLSFLKAKLKDMAQCPGGDAGFSSSSDSDVK